MTITADAPFVCAPNPMVPNRLKAREQQVADLLEQLGYSYQIEPDRFRFHVLNRERGELQYMEFSPDFRLSDTLYIEVTQSPSLNCKRRKIRGLAEHGITVVLISEAVWAEQIDGDAQRLLALIQESVAAQAA